MARDRRPDELPRQDIQDLRLLDFIPAISPQYARPDHFRVVADVLERAIRGDLRVVFSAPVQHGKTTLLEHAIPWWHMRDEKLSIFYVTYAQQYTEIRSRNIRRLTEEVGCRFRDDHKRLDGWSFDSGGRAVMTGVEGPGTGLPGQIFVVDDPFKGPAEAYSAARRQLVYDWYKYVLTARRAPKASHIVIASRWDEDDLSGRLIREGYDEIRLPAICDDVDDPNGRAIGDALCPWGPNPAEPRDLEFLSSLREDLKEHAWAALCQGRPTPREGALFGPATYYDELPTGAELVMVGVDIATSANAGADHSVFVLLAFHNGIYYVHEVIRLQKEMTVVGSRLANLRTEWSLPESCRMASYVSGAEKGIFNLLFYMHNIVIERMPARYDKWTRGQRTARAWREKKIRVRANQPWTPAFVRVIENFTGKDDAVDDDADALVSGYDAHAMAAPVEWAGQGFTFGKAVM